MDKEILEAVTKTLPKLQEVVEFNGFNFSFPCSMRRMSQKEAIEVSKWILKVLRA